MDDFDFQFSRQAEHVSVFYDGQFYLGQVLHVHSPTLADVTFMASNGKQNIFKWPQADDIDQVAAKYVFDSGFSMFPQNRTWFVEQGRWGVILSRWSAFNKLFVDADWS
ncbi:hypothetical protein BaRGS_00023324 [Batillaria attramentaria]|uniref:Uncharacterized protein n=1 Tax=Batillaria attramentaria TaxID=370345 RepID=A0ABD0KED1_9CAEN